MIQRIQTVYLIIVAMLCLAGFFCPLASFYSGTQEIAEFNNWHFSVADESCAYLQTYAPVALGALLVLVMMITIMTIFLFHFRMRQLRLVIFSNILLLGYVGLMALLTSNFTLELSTELENVVPDAALDFRIRAAAIFPVISFILNCLAIHAIRKDEKLVRSLDRLR